MNAQWTDEEGAVLLIARETPESRKLPTNFLASKLARESITKSKRWKAGEKEVRPI